MPEPGTPITYLETGRKWRGAMMQQAEQTNEGRDSASVLRATLDMLTDDFDSMSAAEIRELLWLAREEFDSVMRARKPEARDRHMGFAVTAGRWLGRARQA
jgi:hypothetical protein